MNCPYCGADEAKDVPAPMFDCYTFKDNGKVHRSETCYQRREAQLLALIGEARVAIDRLLHHAFVFPSEDTEGWREAHEAYQDAQALLLQLDKATEVKRGH